MRKNAIPVIAAEYSGDNTSFLEDVISSLKEHGIQPNNMLYRASEQEVLESILRYGTDRAGFPEKKIWAGSEEYGRAILHEDVIFATTEAEIRRGEQPGSDYQTSLKKFAIIEKPLLLVYDMIQFEKLKEKQYRFIQPAKKLDALLAILIVSKHEGA